MWWLKACQKNLSSTIWTLYIRLTRYFSCWKKKSWSNEWTEILTNRQPGAVLGAESGGFRFVSNFKILYHLIFRRTVQSSSRWMKLTESSFTTSRQLTATWRPESGPIRAACRENVSIVHLLEAFNSHSVYYEYKSLFIQYFHRVPLIDRGPGMWPLTATPLTQQPPRKTWRQPHNYDNLDFKTVHDWDPGWAVWIITSVSPSNLHQIHRTLMGLWRIFHKW